MIRAKDRELGTCHTRLQAASAVQARAQVMIPSALQLLFTTPSCRTTIAFLQLHFQLHRTAVVPHDRIPQLGDGIPLRCCALPNKILSQIGQYARSGGSACVAAGGGPRA